LHARIRLKRILLSCALLVSACSAPRPEHAPAEPARPWEVLLDGTSLAGWENIDYGGEGPVELVALPEGGSAVRLGMGSMLTGIRRTDGAALPRFDYELEVVAARLAGTDFFCGLTFPVGEAHATLVLGGWGGALTGLSCLDGLDASDNETKTFRSYKKGQDTTARVRVTRERIQAWVDGESVLDVPIAGRRLSLRAEVEKSRPLGISSYATVARIRSVRLRHLAPGTARLQPGSAAWSRGRREEARLEPGGPRGSAHAAPAHED
jgi:hypothetical protein